MRTKILITIMFVATQSLAQIINPKETAKRKAEDRTNRGIDRTLDKGFDKLEEGIGGIFKKKDKKKDAPQKESSTASEQDASAPDQGQTASSGDNATAKGNSAKPSLKSYSKFDFIPGEQVVGYEDFSQDAIGDFPAKWSTNSSGEVVTIDGLEGKWLMLPSTGLYYPDFINELPDNATIEFDLAVSDNYSEMQSGLKVLLVENSARNLMYNQFFSKDPQVSVDIHPFGNSGGGYAGVWVFDKSENKIIDNTAPLEAWRPGTVNRISIWKQKTRYRMYINETKVWDLPRAFDPTVSYSLLFATRPWEGEVYFANLRVAVGAPDTRSKLITEGKLTTRGITFDIASDKIKPESFGTLKEIAAVLKENAAVHVKIIGHTDSDGDEKSNMELSKRRAEAVKKALVSEFGIAESRMETDGKGESEPAEPNTTPQGKANNRRVEFIKL